MSFQNFTSTNIVAKKYNLTIQREKPFDYTQITPISPPNALQETLEFELLNQPRQATEQSICESLIYPILREIWMRHLKVQLWSHVPLQVDDELTGIPDYLVSKKSLQGLDEIDMPLLAVVEAKREDFSTGWGQCLAGMVASQKFNQKLSFPPTIYGIVTTGKTWEFGQLHKNIFKLHPFNLSITQLDVLLGVLNYVFSKCEAQLTKV